MPSLAAVIVIAVLFFSPYQNFLFAEVSSAEDKFDKEFLRKFRDDFSAVLLSPKKWDRGDILNLSAVLGTGILLYTADKNINRWFQDHRGSSSEDISKIVSPFGHGICLVSLMTVLYASGEISNNNNLRKTALLGLESWITSGIIVLGLKFITGRARPKTGESHHTFHPLSVSSSFTSFPSGDASSAFAVATTIADRSEKAYVDFLAYGLATLVAIFRVHDNKHWASDAFVGSAIGYLVSKKISALNRDQDSKKIKVSFQFSHKRQALSLSLAF